MGRSVVQAFNSAMNLRHYITTAQSGLFILSPSVWKDRGANRLSPTEEGHKNMFNKRDIEERTKKKNNTKALRQDRCPFVHLVG